MKEVSVSRPALLPGIILMSIALSPTVSSGASIPWNLETGLGYDSNPYHTPSSSYIDYAQTGNPLINPNRQSGFFIPLKAEVLLSDENTPGSEFNSEYKLNLTKYLDSDLGNADEYSHRFIIGKTLNRKSAVMNNSDNLYTEFEFGINRQTYFDRDDGLPKTTTGGSNISDRYNYLSYGLSIDYDSKTGAIPYTLTAGVEQLDYDDPVGTTQLDHSRINLGIDSETRLSASSKFKYGYSYSIRNYTSRHARDAAGVISTQTLDYDYHQVDLTLRNRFNDRLVVYFDYKLKLRYDGYVGYNDSTTNSFKIRNIYKTANTRTRLVLTYYTIDYANAFNFEDATQGDKSSDALKLNLKSEFAYAGYQLWTAVELRDKNSTDPRYQYDRYQASLGITMEF